MNIKDRTLEFQRSVVSYKKLYKIGNQDSENKAKNNPSSEFQRNASVVAKEISDAAQLLSKLAILAKRKPMFDDNPVEIAELSFLIKRKIYSIEQQLIKLNQITRNNNTGGNNSVNTKSHSSNVINLLNKKMKNISGDFKSVLEERQKLELINKDRWVKITENTTESAFDTPEPVDNNTSTNDGHLHEQKEVIGYNSSNPFMSSLIDETENINLNSKLILPNSESQLLLMEEGMQNNVYLQERNRAVETIESTIQEVGNLFQQLASMVQQQGEVIQRIDANVDDVDLNISTAQRELLKYFDRIKSNRWLAVKIFFIIFVFFLIWVLVN